MKYLSILDCDIADGQGIRVTLFVSGCSHHCKGCHNPESWNAENGKTFDTNAKEKLFNLLSKDYVDGLTLSGGDPLFCDNISEITELCKQTKEKFPNKTIWLYTGFDFEKIKNLEVIKYVDVVVDGRFIEEKKDTTLAFRGSSNQRIIDAQKSLSENKIYVLDL